MRNLKKVRDESSEHYEAAITAKLMQVVVKERNEKVLLLEGGKSVVEFTSCSYLGLDTHPSVVAGAQTIVQKWGVHLCCARTRFSIGPNQRLEQELSQIFGGRAITFPSVSSAHMSVLPIIAEGIFFDGRRKASFLIDAQAHASMQALWPILEQRATVVKVPHNNLRALELAARRADDNGESPVYVADGVYSMGGHCPVPELFELAQRRNITLYLDDAHGTFVYGSRGEGWVLSHCNGAFPQNTFITFSLAKGLGCNGGGIVVAGASEESTIRKFGQTYAFSTPLDFSIVGAALAALELNRDGTLSVLRQKLSRNIARFAQQTGKDTSGPLFLFERGEPYQAIEDAKILLSKGFFVSVAFFPIVPRGKAQLRVAITAAHSNDHIDGLAQALRELV